MDYYEYNQNNTGQKPSSQENVIRENENDRQRAGMVNPGDMVPERAGMRYSGEAAPTPDPLRQPVQNSNILGRAVFPSGNLFGSVIGQKKYTAITGTVTEISNFSANGCTKLFKVVSDDGSVTNLVIQSDTYFVDHMRIGIGMPVIAFYNANAPAPLIYPPQFQADVVALNTRWENIKVDRFNRSLISDDKTLRLNISDSTDIVLENGQEYDGSLSNRYLIVIYGNTTRSVPAQATPKKIIVMCE